MKSMENTRISFNLIIQSAVLKICINHSLPSS